MEIGKVIKQSRFKSNAQKAHINLLYTSNWLRDISNPIFKKHGILSQHFNVLRIIKGKYPDPVTPGEIIEVMLDKKRDLTRLVDKLVQLGLVDRWLSEENRRNVMITLTDSGLELVDRITEEVDKLQHQMNNLTEDEAGLLSDLLDKMRG